MIIFRWKPLSFQNIRSFWNLALGMGNLNIYENIYEDGILYGVWESGPWAGFKMPKVSAMGWIGGGTAVYDMMVWVSMHFNASQFLCRIIQVWRHTCLSISSSTGKFKLVENGEKAVDKVDSTIIEWMNDIPKKVCISIMTHSLKSLILILLATSQATIFTLGCYYRNTGSLYMSMYGSVTDAQVFSRELSDQEMFDVTTCK